MRARAPSFCSASQTAQTVYLLGFSRGCYFYCRSRLGPSGSTYIAKCLGKGPGVPSCPMRRNWEEIPQCPLQSRPRGRAGCPRAGWEDGWAACVSSCRLGRASRKSQAKLLIGHNKSRVLYVIITIEATAVVRLRACMACGARSRGRANSANRGVGRPGLQIAMMPF